MQIVGGGSGGTAPEFISAPYDALVERAYKDDFQLFTDFDSTNPQVDQGRYVFWGFLHVLSCHLFDHVTKYLYVGQ